MEQKRVHRKSTPTVCVYEQRVSLKSTRILNSGTLSSGSDFIRLFFLFMALLLLFCSRQGTMITGPTRGLSELTGTWRSLVREGGKRFALIYCLG